MRQPETRTIRGRSYTVSALPAMRALRAYPLCSRAVASGFMGLTPDDMQTVVTDLLAMVRCDGKELLGATFNLESAGEVNVLLAEVMPWSFEFNYGKHGDFSAAAHGDAPTAAEKPSAG